jgi:circadian clock protein KaiB
MVKTKKAVKSPKEYEISIGKAKNETYLLKLYITGITPQSLLATDNIKMICEKHLKGRYTLEVIDLYKNPALAKGEQIIAAPTLIKKLPLPLRWIIGNMSDTERVLVGLDLKEVKTKTRIQE